MLVTLYLFHYVMEFFTYIYFLKTNTIRYRDTKSAVDRSGNASTLYGRHTRFKTHGGRERANCKLWCICCYIKHSIFLAFLSMFNWMKRKVSCLLFNVWFPSAVCKNTKPRSVCTLHAANVPPPYKGSNKCADGTLDWHYSMMYIRGTHTHLQGKSAIEHTYTHIHLWVQQYSRKQKL